ncbi:hypothetical protein MRQ36_22895 [Micromonospora sp. R77]|uniref:hypothetical protein n=1 Tax=Micromonospora sp. R77 TaxID=2925836 RepID=UPI001F601ED6|nr:hypothetical protein [Micromonospora sp. R77]MCI4065258.1 hypothetical protein [Micromonospora sp. R77]
MNRWEVGSSYPLLLPPGDGERHWPDDARLYGSGRHALRALLRFGRDELGWRRLHVPGYYCPEVVESVTDLLPVHRFDTGPFGPDTGPDAGPDDVVLTLSYFGEPPVLPDTPATVVVDVTHDPTAPWLSGLRSGYVLASLRKTLPIPDGGLLLSADGGPLPPPVAATTEHLVTAGHNLAAMCLKAAYLAGAGSDKEHYLRLYAAGEAGLRSRTVSGISDFSREALRILPAAALRRSRVANADRLAAALDGADGVRAHPRSFGVLLEFDTPDRRAAVREALIAHRVYPAALWTLPEQDTPPRQLDLSRRLLHLHTDVRYDGSDLDRVAGLVRRSCAAYRSGAPVPQPARRDDALRAR